jgi:hypothetical protein
MNAIVADSGDSPSGRTGKRKRELAAEMEVSDQEEAGRTPAPPAQPEGPAANGVPEEPQGEHSAHLIAFGGYSGLSGNLAIFTWCFDSIQLV